MLKLLWPMKKGAVEDSNAKRGHQNNSNNSIILSSMIEKVVN
jgi:hypothetical protein